MVGYSNLAGARATDSWTRMNTDKVWRTRGWREPVSDFHPSSPIRVHPCPSVATMPADGAIQVRDPIPARRREHGRSPAPVRAELHDRPEPRPAGGRRGG